ncbi:MAG TPA: hypothetical protein VFS02_20060 [Telluria sp.]|nr:hypothetical protein [Telluria sp.]
MFVFLLVSMLVTIGNEMISGALRSRAKWLRMGVERLLGSEWAKQLYAHPLIGGTAQSATSGKAAEDPTSNQGPSYIASRSFANVLMALLHDSAASVQEVGRALQCELNSLPAGPNVTIDALQAQIALAQPKLRAMITAHSHSALADAVTNDLLALRERLKAPYTVAEAQADIQRFIDAMPARYLRQMIEGIEDPGMRKILLALFDDAEGNIEKFKQNIEIWFNNAMDRVSGWYKRRAQAVIAALAVLAAVGMNVDAVLIFKHLQTYPGARDALVAQASKFVASGQPLAAAAPVATQEAGAATPSVNGGDDYDGRLKFTAPADAAGDVTLSSNVADVTVQPEKIAVKKGDTEVAFHAVTQFSDKASTATITAEGAASGSTAIDVRQGLPAQLTVVQKKLTDLGLPIGWVWNPSPAQVKSGLAIPRDKAALGDSLMQHTLGWLITALAATLGAPFWFDTLNRIISIRSAGKAPEEKPKSPKKVSSPLEPGQTPREAARDAAGH